MNLHCKMIKNSENTVSTGLQLFLAVSYLREMFSENIRMKV